MGMAMNKSEILEIEFDARDLGRVVTIREYLHALLDTLWAEGDEFSGKYSFGNSAWQYDLYKPLIQNQAIEGSVDEYGYVEDIDSKKAHKLVRELIKYMCLGEKDKKTPAVETAQDSTLSLICEIKNLSEELRRFSSNGSKLTEE